MSTKQYTDAGFNIKGLLYASLHAVQDAMVKVFDEKDDIDGKAALLSELNITLPDALSHIDMGPIHNPIEGIDYILNERESWISPLTLLVDLLLVNTLIAQLDSVKNLDQKLKDALLIKSKIKITLLVNEKSYYTAFNVLFSHKPLCKEIILSFYKNVENCNDVLHDQAKRMSPEIINTVISANTVKTELRKIASLFKPNGQQIGRSLKIVEEYIAYEKV